MSANEIFSLEVLVSGEWIATGTGNREEAQRFENLNDVEGFEDDTYRAVRI